MKTKKNMKCLFLLHSHIYSCRRQPAGLRGPDSAQELGLEREASGTLIRLRLGVNAGRDAETKRGETVPAELEVRRRGNQAPGGRRATCKGPLRGEYLSGGHQPCKARRKCVQGQGNEENLPWDQCGRTETEGQRAVCKFTRVRWWGLRWVSCPGETCGTPAHLCSQNSLVGPSPNCIKLSFTPSLHFRVFECTIRISQKPRKLSKVQEV